MDARHDEICPGQIDITLIEDTGEDALHEDEAEQPLRESEVDKEDCMGMKARPSCEVDLHHLRVVRNEDLCWLPWCSVHEETVEGPLHADEVTWQQDRRLQAVSHALPSSPHPAVEWMAFSKD